MSHTGEYKENGGGLFDWNSESGLRIWKYRFPVWAVVTTLVVLAVVAVMMWRDADANKSLGYNPIRSIQKGVNDVVDTASETSSNLMSELGMGPSKVASGGYLLSDLSPYRG